MNSHPHTQSNLARWMPVAAAGGLLLAVIAAGVISGRGNGDDPSSSGAAVALPAASTATTEPVATINPEDQVVTGATDVAVQKVALDRTLTDGLAGDDVEMVQARLQALAFDPGPVDGIFGSLTKQAVWAFEKLVMGVPRSEASGKVSPEMWDRMQDPITIQPRRPTGGLADHTEVYLPEQVLIVFHGDSPALVAHMSSGELATGATGFTPWHQMADEYCETITIDTDSGGNLLEEPEEKAICGRSYTPPGIFEAYRKVEGVRNGPLGGMFDPIYINQGIAIHGAYNVPLQPASHGCIRVSQYLGTSLQEILELGDRVLIWDGITEPENQSADARTMRWDYADPNATTTTTSTTSTTSTTVPVPTTDSNPATTQAPPATTTTPPPPATTTTTTPPPTETTTTTTEPPATTTTEPPDNG